MYYNEDMVQYPQVWEKIHAKLADYGFILRYLEDKEHLTGYGYEPWHIRYIDNVELAKQITDQGLTFEEYLGAVKAADVKVDLGFSQLYSVNELKEAAVQVKCQFAAFEGCELHSLRYAGDEQNTDKNIAWMNDIAEGQTGQKGEYVQCVQFLTDFHSPTEGVGAWNPDTEYTDYQWWLARTEGGDWELLTWGY